MYDVRDGHKHVAMDLPGSTSLWGTYINTFLAKSLGAFSYDSREDCGELPEGSSCGSIGGCDT